MRSLPLRVLALAALALASACGGGGGGGGGSSPASFRVTATVPADGTQGVALDTRVRATFSLPVDPSTVAADAIRLGATGLGSLAGTVALVGDGTGRTLEFAPAAPLPSGRGISAVVSAALRSTSGDALGGTTVFSFWTQGGSGVVLPSPSALRPTLGALHVGRRRHTATLLPDGRVLVCGGYSAGTSVTDRAEVFTPSTQTFTLLAAHMRQGRAGHTATLLADGRVLLAGGWYEVSPGTPNTAQTAEVFDPATGTFYDTGSLGVARASHAALRLPDGRVLVTGGSRLEGAFLADQASAEAYDPATGRWTAWPSSLSHTRSDHVMVDLLDGRFLLVGGSDVDLRPEVFDVVTGTFSPIAPAAQDHARFGAAAASFASGDWALVGGESVGDVLHFDRATTRLLNSGSPTSQPRAYATASRIGPDRVLVAGGLDFFDGSLILASCDLVVEGGAGGSGTYATQVRFPTGMADHTATTLLDGRVLFAGGLNATSGQPELDGAYLFTP